MKIHKTAIIESSNIGVGTEIDPFVVISMDVVIGKNCKIHSHVVISSGVQIGDNVEIFPGALIGKEPKGAGVLARQPVFEKIVEIGDDCSIGPNSVIYYDVKIGKNCLIGDGASIREKVTIGNFCIISRYVTISYNTTIGSHTRIMDQTYITGNCIIGDNVFVSVLVSTANDNNLGRLGYNEEKIKGPVIKNGAFIGAGAILLPFVEIGENAIVCAGAVVTKNVLENSKVIGMPARPFFRPD